MTRGSVERPIAQGRPVADTWGIRRLVRSSNGQIGGVFICALLVGLLGGVASGAAGIHADEPTTNSSSNERSSSPEALDQRAPMIKRAPGVGDSAADCWAGSNGIQSTRRRQIRRRSAHAIGSSKAIVRGTCRRRDWWSPSAPRDESSGTTCSRRTRLPAFTATRRITVTPPITARRPHTVTRRITIQERRVPRASRIARVPHPRDTLIPCRKLCGREA